MRQNSQQKPDLTDKKSQPSKCLTMKSQGASVFLWKWLGFCSSLLVLVASEGGDRETAKLR